MLNLLWIYAQTFVIIIIQTYVHNKYLNDPYCSNQLKKKLAWHESIVYMSVFDRCDTIRVNKKTLGPTYSLVQLNVCTDRSGNVISV